MPEPRREPPHRPVIVVHRVDQRNLSTFVGYIMLVDPETGEILHQKEQAFQRCHRMYASYKVLTNCLRDVAERGYTVIHLDTDYKRFGDELKHLEPKQSLQRQLAEGCAMHGIQAIEVINN